MYSYEHSAKFSSAKCSGILNTFNTSVNSDICGCRAKYQITYDNVLGKRLTKKVCGIHRNAMIKNGSFKIIDVIVLK